MTRLILRFLAAKHQERQKLSPCARGCESLFSSGKKGYTLEAVVLKRKVTFWSSFNQQQQLVNYAKQLLVSSASGKMQPHFKKVEASMKNRSSNFVNLAGALSAAGAVMFGPTLASAQQPRQYLATTSRPKPNNYFTTPLPSDCYPGNKQGTTFHDRDGNDIELFRAANDVILRNVRPNPTGPGMELSASIVLKDFYDPRKPVQLLLNGNFSSDFNSPSLVRVFRNNYPFNDSAATKIIQFVQTQIASCPVGLMPHKQDGSSILSLN